MLDQGLKTSNEIGRHNRHWNPLKTVEILLITGLLLFTLTLNLSRAVRAEYNHDEDQFIASARLLARRGSPALP